MIITIKRIYMCADHWDPDSTAVARPWVIQALSECLRNMFLLDDGRLAAFFVRAIDPISGICKLALAAEIELS